MSIFSMSTIVRVLLGTGLIYDAQHANSAFHVQHTIQSSITASNLRCTDGTLPMLQEIPFPSPEFPFPVPDLPFPVPEFPLPEPSPTYEWFAVQLRWICAALCYLVVAESMLSARLTGWLMDTQGKAVADMYTRNQWYNRCVESVVTVFSLVVYIGVDAYELYTQQQMSDRNDDHQWQLFTTEVLMVMLLGIIGLTNTVVQYRMCDRLERGGTDTVTGSML